MPDDFDGVWEGSSNKTLTINGYSVIYNYPNWNETINYTITESKLEDGIYNITMVGDDDTVTATYDAQTGKLECNGLLGTFTKKGKEPQVDPDEELYEGLNGTYKSGSGNQIVIKGSKCTITIDGEVEEYTIKSFKIPFITLDDSMTSIIYQSGNLIYGGETFTKK